MLAWIPPWIPLILGALVLPCCAPRWRPWLLLGLPLVGLYLVWQGTDGVVVVGADACDLLDLGIVIANGLAHLLELFGKGLDPLLDAPLDLHWV